MNYEPTWVGIARCSDDGAIALGGAVRPWSPDYRKARVLVVEGDAVLGWCEVTDREPSPALVAADLPRLRRAATEMAAVDGEAGSTSDASDDFSRDAMTVVVCTRERPAALAQCLQRLTEAVAEDRSDPPTEILVVDNAPRSDATAEVVAAAAASASTPIRRVLAAKPGLSRARNVGLEAAPTDIVVFTDDDVLVDRHWLRGLRRGFARPDTVLVTGLVPSAELDTHVQACFDRQVRWSSRLRRQHWTLGPRSGTAGSFPYAAGQFGTGASMAVRRPVVVDLGGFDERLGAGTRSRGGEDLEMFVRVLRAGHGLAYEPSAIAWHVHRRDDEAFRRQVFSYGTGLAAYVTALALQPGRRDLLRGASLAAVELGRARQRGTRDEAPRADNRRVEPDRVTAGAGYLEWAGLAWGVPAYLSERFGDSRIAPSSHRGAA